jgi:M6 family metalloprotease-like protein
MLKFQKNILLLSCLLIFSSLLFSAYLRDYPMDLRQPDGTSVVLFATGDEYYNWLHDKDGFTARQNDDGWYVYLNLDERGELVFTDLVVGRDNPSDRSLSPGINISAERIGAIRDSFQSHLSEIDSGRAPSTGTINNLVIFIRFADQTEFGQNLSTYSSMFNGTTGNTMQNYFLEASYNQLNISTTFYPTPSSMVVSWQDTAHTRAYFSPYNATTNTIGYQNDTQRREREHTLLVQAVNGVSSQIPAGLNLDGDNDGKVDNVCFIIKGGTDAWASLLWPHRWSLYTYTVNINGKRVYDYNFQLSEHLASSGNGVLCHEMFHSLGAPDLYHYTSNGITPVGYWDLMEYNYNPPQHMGAYMKWKYGHWIPSIPVISAGGTYTLNSLTSSTGQVFRINSPNSTSQYYIVEYRKKTGTFENSLPGSGMLIYRINTAANGNAQGPPDEVYVYRLNGTPTVNGTVTSATFSSETGRTSFNNTTNPYCFLADGTLGNISISQVGSSAGTAITFHVTLDNAPLNLTGSSAGGTISLAWDAPMSGTPTGYKVYRNGSFLANSAATTYCDANVTIGTTYSYHVTAMFSNPTSESSPSNSVQVTATDMVQLTIGTETTTNKGLPMEPNYAYTYSQSIYLQSQLNIPGSTITRLAWRFNGNSVWTDNIKIYMGHTSLTAFPNNTSWIPLSGLTQVYDGTITTCSSAGWIELVLDTPFYYNNTQNLVIAVDENTAGAHTNSDEFYVSAVTGNRSLHYYSNSINPDPASPPVSGNTLLLKAFVPNVQLTFSSSPIFSVTPTAVSFGTVYTGTQNSQTVRVTNAGSGSLIISAINLSNGQFSLSGLPTFPRTLTNQQYFEFTVHYNPQTAASNSANLNITDNLSRTVRVIPVSGTAVVPPQISVSPMSYATTISIGETTTRTFQISNTGGQMLNYSIQLSGNPAWLSLSSASGSVAPGQNQSVVLSVLAQNLTAGVYQVTMTISSNAPAAPTLQIPIQVTVISTIPTPAISINSQGISLTWGIIPNAIAYRIYKSSSPTGEFTPVSTVVFPSYTDTSNNNQRFYRIVALFE